MTKGERLPVHSLNEAMRQLQTAKAKRGDRVQTMNVEHFPEFGTTRRHTVAEVFSVKMRNKWRDGAEEFVTCLAFEDTPLVLPLEEERLQATLEAADDDAAALKGRTAEIWLEEKLSKDGKTKMGGRWPYKRMVKYPREPGEDDDVCDGSDGRTRTPADDDDNIPF